MPIRRFRRRRSVRRAGRKRAGPAAPASGAERRSWKTCRSLDEVADVYNLNGKQMAAMRDRTSPKVGVRFPGFRHSRARPVTASRAQPTSRRRRGL